MGLHKPKPNPNKKRAANELWWSAMDADTQVIMRGASHIKGWLLRLDDPFGGGELWVARSEDGSVRAEFDNINEAQDFLWAIVNMGANNEI